MKAKIHGTDRVLEQEVYQATYGHQFDYIQLDFRDLSQLLAAPDPLDVLAILYTRMVITSEVVSDE